MLWLMQVTSLGPAMALGSGGLLSLDFRPSGQHLNPLAARGVSLADFDGDGDLDAWFVNDRTADGDGHRVYLNDGAGRFADSGQRLKIEGYWNGTPAVGDVNGDGSIDVVVAGMVWLNDVAGRFTGGASFTSDDAEVPCLGQLADVDGDGDLDVAGVVKWREWRVWRNDGHGRFHQSGPARGSGMIGALAVGDLNGDGCTDVFTAGWTMQPGQPSPNQVWFNDGRGAFAAAGGAWDLAEHHVHGVATGDVDRDGDLDLVLALTTPGHAGRVYRNNGRGKFSDSGQTLGERWAHAVALADFDGDGSLDVFLACGDPKPGTPNQVWINDGGGRFADSGLRLGHAFSWSVALGDVNGDGRTDAVVANLRLVDDTKAPPVFGGEPAEAWLNESSLPATAAGSRDAPSTAATLVLHSVSMVGGIEVDDLGWLRKPRFGEDGRLYFAGTTRSPGFPVAPGSDSPPYQGGNDWGTEDVFLARYDPATRTIDPLRLLGGAQGPEFVADLQIDPRGSIHLVGNTGSADFPTTTDAAQSAFGGPVFRHADGFLTVIAPAGGGIGYSSFFGAGGNDWLLQLFLDPDGSATVFGMTDSSDFLPPELTLRDPALAAAPTLFVARLEGRTHQIVRARLLANTWDAAVERLDSGAFVIAGTTTHPAFAATDGAYDRSYNGGSAQAGGDLFLLRLSGDLMRIEFATLFGGGGDELSPRIEILPSGEILLGGRTTSVDLPVTTSKRSGPQNEGKQLFLARFTEDGSRVVFCDTLTDAHPSHRLGAMAHDGERRLAFVGSTASEALPFSPRLRQPRFAGDSDAFLLVFDTDENAIVQCTLLGGSGSDAADALAFGRDGRLYVLGTTDSEDFPGCTAPSRRGQGGDVFVAEFAQGERVSELQPDSRACDGAARVAATRATNQPSAGGSR